MENALKTLLKSKVLKRCAFANTPLDPRWPSTTGLVSWLECQAKMGQMSDSSGPDTKNGEGGTPNTKPREALPTVLQCPQ